MADVKPVPDGYHSVIPYIIVHDGAAAIDFYTRVFGATERMRLPGRDGKIGHAEIGIGDSVIMLADEFPDMGARGPKTIGGTPVSVMLYLEDVDGVVARATSAGATIIQPLEDKFYGDRAATLRDPFGHEWHVATHVEDVPPDEMERRAALAAAHGGDS